MRFAGAPITWASKMQTITAMSTGGVHRSLHQLKGCHPHDGNAPGGKGAWSQGGLLAAESALHCLQR